MPSGRRSGAMNRSEFSGALREKYGASQHAIQLVDRLCDLYQEVGVLPGGVDMPLNEICPRCAECWEPAEDRESPSPTEAGISAPFIGANYGDRRICVVGMNFNGAGGLEANWWICGLHIEAQRAGKRGVRGLPFAYGAMSYARLVERSLARLPLDDWERPMPTTLAPTWDACAFTQAIKCSPRRPRGSPFPAMFSNCPSLLFVQELAILRPRVVLILGRAKQPRDSVRSLLRPEWRESPGHIERDRFQLNGEDVELLSLNHPSSPSWRLSLRQLEQSLSQRPMLG